jgi:hypothetical protein
MPTPYLGLDAKAYYGTAGSTATTELTNVKDVTLNLESREADVTVRGGDGWVQTTPTLKDASVEFQMLYDEDDSSLSDILDAYLNQTSLAFYFRSKTGGEGLDADFRVVSATRTEGNEEALMLNVTLKPTTSSRAPAWT